MKNMLNSYWSLAPINLNNAHLKLDREVLSWIFLGRLFREDLYDGSRVICTYNVFKC